MSKDVTLASGRVLTEDEVVEYFQRLNSRQLRHNKALAEAGRAMLRLQKRHAPGPGRPPTLVCQAPKRCRCADCRRKFPHYRHEPSRRTNKKRKGKPTNEQTIIE